VKNGNQEFENSYEEEKYSFLEKNLLKISKMILSKKEHGYQDDVIATLKDIYCIKNIEKDAVHQGAASSLTFKERIKNLLMRLSSSPYRSRRGPKKFRGIDGRIYQEYEFASWKKSRPLIKCLVRKIRNKEFDPDW